MIPVLIGLSLVLLICLGLTFLKNRPIYPPGPRGVPWLGYLPNFLGSTPYDLFDLWAQKFGDLYSVKIAGRRYFVLSSYDRIREAYVTDGHGNNFSSRPPGFNVLGSFFEFRPMPFKNGPEWALQRKLFSSMLRRSDPLLEASICQSAQAIVRRVGEVAGQGPLDVYHILAEGVLNVVSTLVCGQRLGETEPEVAKQIIEDTYLLFANAPGGDAIFSGFLHKLFANRFTAKGQIGQTIFQRQFRLMERFVREHERDFDANNLRDYIDTCLHERNKNNSEAEKQWFSIPNLVSNMFIFYVAGVDSTATQLYWALFLLAKHPDVQKRVVEEMEHVLGSTYVGDGTYVVKGSDRGRLPYLVAVVNEISRYVVVGPLPQPRSNVEKTKISGYEIPAGSHFITNLWSATRDGKYFENPRQFDPNNFYGKKLPRDLCALAFSAGKRGCPGENLATTETFLFIAHILQNFEISEAPTNELKEVTAPGFLRTLTPFKLIFKKRIISNEIPEV